MDKKNVLRRVGGECADFRRFIGATQKDVARELQISNTNVSAFESGLNDSCYMLCWYISKGLELGYIFRGEKNDG